MEMILMLGIVQGLCQFRIDLYGNIDARRPAAAELMQGSLQWEQQCDAVCSNYIDAGQPVVSGLVPGNPQ